MMAWRLVDAFAIGAVARRRRRTRQANLIQGTSNDGRDLPARFLVDAGDEGAFVAGGFDRRAGEG